MQQKKAVLCFSLPGARGREGVEGTGTTIGHPVPEEHMLFGKSYFCPWAAAVWTTAESESAMTETLTATFVGYAQCIRLRRNKYCALTY